MYGKKWDLTVKGVHKPLIDRDIWEQAYDKVIMKNKSKYKHQDNRLYLLKGFIECTTCNRPMTSSNPKGRTKRYIYYMCNSCKKSFNADEAHNQFEAILHNLISSKNVLILLREMIQRDWDLVNGEAQELIDKIDQQIVDTKEELKVSVKAKNSGDYPEAMAKEEIDKSNAKLISLNASRSDVKIMEYSAEIITNFFENFINNLDRFWRVIDLPKKQAFQKAVFPEGITYFAGEIRTANLSPLFNQIEALEDENVRNVTLRQVSLNRF